MRTILFCLALLGAVVGRGQIVLDWYTMPIVGGCFPVWDKTPYTSGDMSTFMSCLVANFNQTQTVNAVLVGSASFGSNSHAGGVLAPNGNIYAVGRNVSSVLRYDPSTGTSSVLTGGFSGYFGCVLGLDGSIYGIPEGATQVVKFDPTTNTSTLVGSTLSGAAKWLGGVLAPNGKIYGIPYSSTQVLEFDPATNTSTLVGGTLTGTNKWAGGVLAPNGKIYGIPLFSTRIVEILNPPATAPDQNAVLSRHLNKY